MKLLREYISFLSFSIIYSIQAPITESNIYYTPPSFNLNFANVTLGSSKANIDGDRNGESLSVGESISTICQAELINKKLTPFSINGIINIAYQDFISRQSSGQAAILELLSNNIKGLPSNFNFPGSFDLTGFFGVSNYGTLKINSLIGNYYGIPFVTAADLARSAPDNRFSSNFPAENFTFFQILDTYNYNSFSAILQILNHFNWSLVGTVYQDNAFGYDRKELTMNYAANNTVPRFACSIIYYFEAESEAYNESLQKSLKFYCKCINEKNTLKVHVLWMSTSASLNFITNLRDVCSEAKDWTFIIAEDFQSPPDYGKNADNLKNSLLLRANGPWNYTNFVHDCLANTDTQTLKTIKRLLNRFLLLLYNCQLESDEPLKRCAHEQINTEETCLCDLNVLEQNPYVSKLFFAADLISTYAQGISILQNNCTFLNEKAIESKLVGDVDYCSKTTFEPVDLTFALRFINFTGYTGPIEFPKNTMIRKTKSFFLYSVYNTTYDAVLVGTLNETSVIIDDDAIKFVNDETPTSEIVPQNPDLSYAVVDVFFAVSILELTICISLFILFVIHINYRCIKRMSPLLSLIILFGITSVALSQLMSSFARTDAFCIIDVYFSRLGLITIFSGLIIKYYRIYKIFANKEAVALSIPEPRLILFVVAITAFYLGVITIFIAVLGFEAVLRTSDDNVYYQYIQCLVPYKAWNLILELFMQIFFILMLIVSLILVWLTRKVHSDYRDSRTLATYIILVTAAFIIFAPMEYTFGSETDSEIFRYVIKMEFMTVLVVSGLSLLFIPKVFLIYKEKKTKTREND